MASTIILLLTAKILIICLPDYGENMSAPRQPHIIIKCDMYVALFIFNFSLAMFVEAPSLLGYVNINCSFYKQTNKQTTRNQEKKKRKQPANFN